MKLEISSSYDERQKKQIYFHGILAVITLFGIIAIHSTVNYDQRSIVTGGGLVILTLLGFSLLDYLEIIQFRKSSERRNKCHVCGRTYQSETKIPQKSIEKEFRQDKEDEDSQIVETTTDYKHIKERPLDGIVVFDKLICTDCVHKIQKVKWE